MKEKYNLVSIETEINLTNKLVEEIALSGWVDNDVIIVNCFPDYSSITCQIINHKLSYLNNNNLYEQIQLELPYKGMSQIWNRNDFKPELFDKYLTSWIYQNVNTNYKYLFVSSRIIDAKPFNKLRSLMLDKSKDFKFACLHLQDDFIPSFKATKIPNDKKLLYGWENSDVNNF